MNRASQAPTRTRSRSGQALVLVAVMMGGLLGVGALAVDLGYLYVTRNELQNVSDGAALAGARMLGHIYQGVSYQDQAGFVCGAGCVDSIQGVAQSVASQNSAAAEAMSLRTEDVAIGQWDGNTFTPTLTSPDAVQVIARRDEVANGPVGTFFARTLGIFTGSVNAIAVAALTGQGTTTPGEVELPIGISRYFFDNNPNGEFCHQDIQFYPTNDPAVLRRLDILELRFQRRDPEEDPAGEPQLREPWHHRQRDGLQLHGRDPEQSHVRCSAGSLPGERFRRCEFRLRLSDF